MESSIKENIKRLNSEIDEGIELVAVSKFNAPERIAEAYAAGQRVFGESRVQELATKFDLLPDDIRWHFIGHLQTNKVKPLIGRVAMIESVDSERLLNIISKESERKEVVTDILLQLHVAAEETKFGFTPSELKDLMSTRPWERYKGVRLRGVMGMASNTDNQERIRQDFKAIRTSFDEIKAEYGEFLPAFDTVSMGMSGDWQLAVEQGSTTIRLGSSIFGARMYQNKH